MAHLEQQSLMKATNFSQPTSCAEDDNVSVACFVPDGLTAFDVIATHPTYDISLDNCAEDFTGCPPGGTDFTFAPATQRLFDEGRTVIDAVRLAQGCVPISVEIGFSPHLL